MNESSGVPPATHTLSSCRRFAYRCRLTCFSNCSGGAECNGERIYFNPTPPATPLSMSTASISAGPTPAAWCSLQGNQAVISTFIVNSVQFLFVTSEEEMNLVEVNQADAVTDVLSITPVVAEPVQSQGAYFFTFHFFIQYLGLLRTDVSGLVRGGITKNRSSHPSSAVQTSSPVVAAAVVVGDSTNDDATGSDSDLEIISVTQRDPLLQLDKCIKSEPVSKPGTSFLTFCTFNI